MALIDNNSDTRNRRGALAFALCVIGVLQLSSAAHQFEHVPGYIESTCKVCIQLDRVDDTIADDATPTSPPPFVRRPASRLLSFYVARVVGHGFDARAPPYL